MARKTPAIVDNDAKSTVNTAIEDVGEMALYLPGGAMVLRPSYEAIVAVEQTLGRGLVDLAGDALAKRLTLPETAQIACKFIRAWGNETGNNGAAKANPDRVAKLIYTSEKGFHEALKALSAVLSLAVTGGYDAEGKLKPSAMTTMEQGKAPAGG